MNNSIFSKINWPSPFAGLRGITMAALMIPLNIGYAQVAGLPASGWSLSLKTEIEAH